MSKKRKSNFKGKVGRNVEKQNKEASSYGYITLPKDVKVFSPKPGSNNNRLDFMPYKVTDSKHSDRDDELEIAVIGSPWYKRPFKIHRDVGSGNDAVVCLSTIGKKCPICEYYSKRQKEGAEKEELDALRPKQRNLYIVIPLNSKEHEVEPHIFDISQYLFQKQLNAELDEDESNEIFPDLEEGKTVKVRFESKSIGKGPAFAEAGRIDFLERDDQYSDDELEKMPNLDEVLKILTYNELERLFHELDDDDVDEKDKSDDTFDDDDEVERKRKKAKKKAKKAKKKKDAEDEDDPDETSERTN